MTVQTISFPPLNADKAAMLRPAPIVFAALAVLSPIARATPPDAELCTGAIRAVERTRRLPAHLLDAIGMVESGRYDHNRGTAKPWPWTINVNGVGTFYDSKAEAIQAVMQLQAAGVKSIDVGCMQINLMHHPDAFRSLDEAFDPEANTAYAAHFLTGLFQEMSDWPQATGAYHSRTPDLGAAYAQRVLGLHVPVPDAADRLDPYHVATPEFLARLKADATARRARDAALTGDRSMHAARVSGSRTRVSG